MTFDVQLKETPDHTMEELYTHRHILFYAVCKAYQKNAWKSKYHNNGKMDIDYFIAGIGNNITYHIPVKYWELYDINELDFAPYWNGHTSQDVLLNLIFLHHPLNINKN